MILTEHTTSDKEIARQNGMRRTRTKKMENERPMSLLIATTRWRCCNFVYSHSFKFNFDMSFFFVVSIHFFFISSHFVCWFSRIWRVRVRASILFLIFIVYFNLISEFIIRFFFAFLFLLCAPIVLKLGTQFHFLCLFLDLRDDKMNGDGDWGRAKKKKEKMAQWYYTKRSHIEC